ncbi:WG repeat-containing protein [Chitinophaga filiformis]|uniref:WG repeat-containing protein n=1 Tax=Chitinophaga filiformis TaxID=104663 RepID=UPI001F291D7F|nr:WG repeat-containing protein [Chitinophaga filiformis]MCF6403103.1 WG repeat-containing protein [Chitinophaga filiformis]
MMLRFLLLSIMSLYALASTAQDTLTYPDTSHFHLLYGIIKKNEPENTPGKARWAHRTILYDALKIDGSTPDSIVAGRMQLAWQQVANVRVSESDEPPLRFRDLLRVALQEGYGVLLLDAVVWKIDLNDMNRDLRKTLIDQLELQYRENSDEGRAEWLREYKQLLLAGGAKYFIELDYRMGRLSTKYERVRPPLYGMVAVRRNGKWGWLDEHNNPVVPLRYKAVRYTNGKVFEVSNDGTHFTMLSVK